MPLTIEELALLGVINRYVGLRSELAQEATKVVDCPTFNHLKALYSLDSMLQRHYVVVDPVTRKHTLTETGLSALYEGVERMDKLTQTFRSLQ